MHPDDKFGLFSGAADQEPESDEERADAVSAIIELEGSSVTMGVGSGVGRTEASGLLRNLAKDAFGSGSRIFQGGAGASFKSVLKNHIERDKNLDLDSGRWKTGLQKKPPRWIAHVWRESDGACVAKFPDWRPSILNHTDDDKHCGYARVICLSKGSSRFQLIEQFEWIFFYVLAEPVKKGSGNSEELSLCFSSDSPTGLQIRFNWRRGKTDTPVETTLGVQYWAIMGIDLPNTQITLALDTPTLSSDDSALGLTYGQVSSALARAIEAKITDEVAE